jgi:hypothetical protein
MLPQIGQISFTGREPNRARSSYCGGTKNDRRRKTMPLLLPVLIGIPVVVGGGWIIYKIVS